MSVASEAGLVIFFLTAGQPFLGGATTASTLAWGSEGTVVIEMVNDEVLTVLDSWSVIEVDGWWPGRREGGVLSRLTEGSVGGVSSMLSSTVVSVGSAGGGGESSCKYS